MSLRIDYLARHLRLAPTLARWHHREWRALLPDWSEQQALSELQTHGRERALPTTLVAFEGARLAGSVSLVVSDHRELDDPGPWLASLYVDASLRRRGIGRALVARLREEARALSLDPIYLFTADRADWYAGLGWTRLRAQRLGNGIEVAVMCVSP